MDDHVGDDWTDWLITVPEGVMMERDRLASSTNVANTKSLQKSSSRVRDM